MLNIPRNIEIYIAIDYIDMRKSFEGLSLLVVDVLQCNPLHGQLFVFRNKRGDKLKLFWWDRNGFCIWYKRIEKGTFKWPREDAVSLTITAQELELLLDGVDLKKIKRHSEIHLTSVM